MNGVNDLAAVARTSAPLSKVTQNRSGHDVVTTTASTIRKALREEGLTGTALTLEVNRRLRDHQMATIGALSAFAAGGAVIHRTAVTTVRDKRSGQDLRQVTVTLRDPVESTEGKLVKAEAELADLRKKLTEATNAKLKEQEAVEAGDAAQEGE